MPPPPEADPIQPPPDATLRMLLVWWGYRRRPLPSVVVFGDAPRIPWVRVNGPVVVYDSTRLEHE
jgi:hypothetical protein